MVNSPDLPPLAQALKAYRARHSLSQSRLAQRWPSCPARTIEEWESARAPDSTLARVLADRLNEL